MVIASCNHSLVSDFYRNNSLMLVKQGRPVLFTQKRLGLNARVFNIYKFRTMTTGAHLARDGLQVKDNDVRITKFGNMLRSTSLDELPQLFNILLGDIAIVDSWCLSSRTAAVS